MERCEFAGTMLREREITAVPEAHTMLSVCPVSCRLRCFSGTTVGHLDKMASDYLRLPTWPLIVYICTSTQHPENPS